MDPFELKSIKLKFRTAMEAAVAAVSRLQAGGSSYWLENGGHTPTMQLAAFKHFLKQLSISKEPKHDDHYMAVRLFDALDKDHNGSLSLEVHPSPPV